MSLKTNIGQLTNIDNDFTFNETSDETIEILLEEEPMEEQSQSLLQFQPEKKFKKKNKNKKMLKLMSIKKKREEY